MELLQVHCHQSLGEGEPAVSMKAQRPLCDLTAMKR